MLEHGVPYLSNKKKNFNPLTHVGIESGIPLNFLVVACSQLFSISLLPSNSVVIYNFLWEKLKILGWKASVQRFWPPSWPKKHPGDFRNSLKIVHKFHFLVVINFLFRQPGYTGWYLMLLKVITKSKVGSLRQAQLWSVVEWRHWYARYFSSIYSAVRIIQNFTLNLLKCFSKLSDIFLKILWNIYRNPP